MSVRALALAALVWLAIAPPAVAVCWAAVPLDPLRAYDAQLHAASAQLRAAAIRYRHAPPKARWPVPEIHVPPAPIGQTPVYSPSLDDWLQANLKALRQEPNRRRGATLRQLAQTLDLAASIRQPHNSPPQETHAAVRSILAQDGYQLNGGGAAPPPGETLWEKIVRWIGHLLSVIFGRVFATANAVPFVGQVLAVLLLAGLLFAIGYGAVVLFRGRARRVAGALDVGDALEAHLDPEALYERAQAAAGAGRYGQAIALLFQASLACLDRAGTILYDPSRTAGEYRRLVRRNATVVSQPFDALAGSFTAAAYAEERPSDSDWAAARSAFLELRPLVV